MTIPLATCHCLIMRGELSTLKLLELLPFQSLSNIDQKLYFIGIIKELLFFPVLGIELGSHACLTCALPLSYTPSTKWFFFSNIFSNLYSIIHVRTKNNNTVFITCRRTRNNLYEVNWMLEM
jgi:hypothetical protein